MVIVSLFLDWYDDVTGFTVFEALDLVLARPRADPGRLVAGGSRHPAGPGLRCMGALVGGRVAALMIVVSQLAQRSPGGRRLAPGPAHAVGIWLALGGAVLMLVGVAAVTRVASTSDLDRKDAPAEAAAPAADADAQPPPSGRRPWGTPGSPVRGRRGRQATRRPAAAGAEAWGRAGEPRRSGRVRRLGGVMEAACRGAKAAGAPRSAHPAAPTLRPPTIGGHRARHRARRGPQRRDRPRADALIAVGGGYGTLSEIALALRVGKAVVGLDTWELARAGRAAEDIVRAASPEESVELALRAAGA